METLKESGFVVYVQDCIPAVDHIKGTFGEHPPSGISHLKLNLRERTHGNLSKEKKNHQLK